MDRARALKQIPVIGPALRAARSSIRRATFPGSKGYWEGRYAKGGNSGAGSYGQLGEFKAEVLNGLVREQAVRRVLEFGCGDGSQLTRAEYPEYIGLDVARSAIQLCKQRFSGDLTKGFYLYDSECFVDSARLFDSDLTMSLDVIFHLTEDHVFEQYMHDLFDKSTRLVVVYSSDLDRDSLDAHYRDRRFTAWVDEQQPEFELVNKIDNRFPYNDREPDRSSTADFFIFQRRTPVS